MGENSQGKNLPGPHAAAPLATIKTAKKLSLIFLKGQFHLLLKAHLCVLSEAEFIKHTKASSNRPIEQNYKPIEMKANRAHKSQHLPALLSWSECPPDPKAENSNCMGG
jgi:hypothetical protein